MKNEIILDRELLSKGVDINYRDEITGETAFCKAADCGHINVLRFLKDSEANLFLNPFNGRNPLRLAAFNGHNECVQ